MTNIYVLICLTIVANIAIIYAQYRTYKLIDPDISGIEDHIVAYTIIALFTIMIVFLDGLLIPKMINA